MESSAVSYLENSVYATDISMGVFLPGKGWFGYFRLYAPTEAYFDKTWPLPDFEKVK